MQFSENLASGKTRLSVLQMARAAIITVTAPEAECTSSAFSGKQDDLAVQLNHQEKQQILGSRKKITPIIEAITLCGRQRDL